MASIVGPVRIDAGAICLDGDLVLTAQSQGAVLFAHGSGSGRHSPRNRYVAQVLQQAGFATLLIDLLTVPEEAIDLHTAHLRFDIEFLAKRLLGATDWLRNHPRTRHLRIGYFGASTGSAAALLAAAECPDVIKTVVSRGGRPDLAGPALAQVRAPTLLIVGAEDHPVIEMNREAMTQLTAAKRLEIIPGATHLFEEPGALEKVGRLSCDWFERYLIAKS